MYQNLQQLKSLSLNELSAYKSEATAKKAELENLKAKGGKAWTEEAQNSLDEVVLFLVDLDEAIEEKVEESKKVEEPKKAEYTPKKGTEKMVHASIVHGRRFNAMTGKEESKPYTQLFTFAEWQVFKKHFKSLGYTIMAILHNPYEDASELVVKNK